MTVMLHYTTGLLAHAPLQLVSRSKASYPLQNPTPCTESISDIHTHAGKEGNKEAKSILFLACLGCINPT
jgi:hypothetical protein